jgi:hypothetical protein
MGTTTTGGTARSVHRLDSVKDSSSSAKGRQGQPQVEASAPPKEALPTQTSQPDRSSACSLDRNATTCMESKGQLKKQNKNIASHADLGSLTCANWEATDRHKARPLEANMASRRGTSDAEAGVAEGTTAHSATRNAMDLCAQGRGDEAGRQGRVSSESSSNGAVRLQNPPRIVKRTESIDHRPATPATSDSRPGQNVFAKPFIPKTASPRLVSSKAEEETTSTAKVASFIRNNSVTICGYLEGKKLEFLVDTGAEQE